MSKAKKTPAASLPPKKVTVIVQGKIHKKFFKKVVAAGSSMQQRINELIVRDLEL